MLSFAFPCLIANNISIVIPRRHVQQFHCGTIRRSCHYNGPPQHMHHKRKTNINLLGTKDQTQSNIVTKRPCIIWSTFCVEPCQLQGGT
jgi:hypothetical protein